MSALGFTDWRGVFLILAAASLAIALFVVLVAPDKSRAHPQTTFVDAGRGLTARR